MPTAPATELEASKGEKKQGKKREGKKNLRVRRGTNSLWLINLNKEKAEVYRLL